MPPIPSTKWSGTGQLCTVINSARAGDILGHPGKVTAAYDPKELPATRGVDACTYTDVTSPGFAANIAVLRDNNAYWEAIRRDFKSRGYAIQDYSVPGADGAVLFIQRGQLSQMACFFYD